MNYVSETAELTELDQALLRSWHIQWGEPLAPNARKIVLIGRLQRKLRVIVDGLYGPHTENALRREGNPTLGPELSHIVNDERVRRGWTVL